MPLFADICCGPIDMLNLANPNTLRVNFRPNKGAKNKTSIGHILRQNGEYEVSLLLHIDAQIFLPTSIFEDQKQSISFNVMRQEVETKIGILAIVSKFLHFAKSFSEEGKKRISITPSTVFINNDDVEIYGRLLTNANDAFGNPNLDEEKNNTFLTTMSNDSTMVTVTSLSDPTQPITVPELIASQGRAFQAAIVFAPVIFVSTVTGITHIKLHFDPKYICIIRSIGTQNADIDNYFSQYLLSTAGRKLMKEKSDNDEREAKKNN